MLRDAKIDFDALGDLLVKTFQVADENCTRDAQTLVFSLENNTISVALMDTPVPEGEAEFVRRCHRWQRRRENGGHSGPLYTSRTRKLLCNIYKTYSFLAIFLVEIINKV